jgi:ATP adenylyltransferase
MEVWRKLEYQFQAFNLLVTQNWMLVIPRRAESFDGISVNSLGYAGALLVKTEQELIRLKRQGPMALLAEVSQPCS